MSVRILHAADLHLDSPFEALTLAQAAQRRGGGAQHGLAVQQHVALHPFSRLGQAGDGAGQRAIARGLDLFEQENVPARVTVVPGGMDPDEYVRAKGGQALSDLGSIDPTTYRLDTLAAKYDLSNAEARAKYAVDASQVLRRLEDPVEVERFVRRLTIETGFSEETLMEQVGKRRAPKGGEYRFLLREK